MCLGMGYCSRMQCIPIAAEDIKGLADFAEREKIDLTVVGPEVPLVAGIGDTFASRGLKLFGPKAKAALLEGSKVFAKEKMVKYGLRTAAFEVFKDTSKAISFVRKLAGPVWWRVDWLRKKGNYCEKYRRSGRSREAYYGKTCLWGSGKLGCGRGTFER